MKTIAIIPAVHRRVIDPVTNKVLPDSVPTQVQATSYWLRRLRMGDVVLVETDANPGKGSVEKTKPRKAKAAEQVMEEPKNVDLV